MFYSWTEGNSHKDLLESVLKSMRTLGSPRLDVSTGDLYDVEDCITTCDTNILASVAQKREILRRRIIYAYTIHVHYTKTKCLKC